MRRKKGSNGYEFLREEVLKRIISEKILRNFTKTNKTNYQSNCTLTNYLYKTSEPFLIEVVKVRILFFHIYIFLVHL